MSKGWIGVTLTKFKSKMNQLNKKWKAMNIFEDFTDFAAYLRMSIEDYDAAYDGFVAKLQALIGNRAKQLALAIGEYICVKSTRSIEYMNADTLSLDEAISYKKVAELGNQKEIDGKEEGCILTGFHDTIIDGVSVKYALSLWKFDDRIYLISDYYGNIDYKLHVRKKFWVTADEPIVLSSVIRDRTGVLGESIDSPKITCDTMSSIEREHIIKCERREAVLIDRFLYNATEDITWLV